VAADDITRTRSDRVVLWQRCAAGKAGEPGIRDTQRGDERGSERGSEPPQAEHSERWTELAVARIRASGAEVLAGIGATVVAAFDSIELIDAVELARSLADDAGNMAGELKVSLGVAIGEVEQIVEPGKAPTYRGAVIDRAQALANRARAGEVVLDADAAAGASEQYLFGREISAGGTRGVALDPHNARKEDCRLSLALLQPLPLAKSASDAFDSLRVLALTEGQTRIALQCASPFAALDLVDRLAALAPPPLRLRISRKAGGLQPLGGLELALRRAWPDDAAREAAGLPPALRAVLKTLLRGQAVARADMVEALSKLLELHVKGRARPWIVLDQLHEIDPATLGVVAETLITTDLDCLLVMTLPIEANVPPALMPKGELHQLVLPELSAPESRALAAAILSLDESSDVAQRVAALGGDSALGVLESARTLISAGDLVPRGGKGARAKGFAWRDVPRSGAGQIPVEALITERALGLPHSAYRVLETLCLAPPDASRELIEAVIGRDGMNESELDAGLVQLSAEGFVESGLGLGSADATIRAAVRNSMPPARAAELHRFVAEELRSRQKAPGFGSAQVAFHLAEGGQESEASRALLDAGGAAAGAGFQRVALRLLATAVELDGSADVRKLASEIASTVEAAAAAAQSTGTSTASLPKVDSIAPASEPPNMALSAMRSACKAFTERDYDAAERWIDTAVAAGWGRAAAHRMQAIAQLARGDTSEATLTLSRASTVDAAPEVQARVALSWALIHMESGHPRQAVRDALGALATSRRTSDKAGELAALHVLAFCYGNLDRADEAKRIAEAAQARSS
jgi:hypothetical protein